ncbi:hypothetical protein LCGC14_0284910 [marine sediment metagenome]|uniref:Serine aminopeptidase S33 domain-containing protein n=1 Tax=marine sediment metagenome TaxID=412755 RepID=A0A0F9UBW2_9ZZZZ|nr:alpha/beta fold hydrolase [Phycisphaerae bacterium]HDZ45024.1 alpha/beta fold hydrolase [Phycisphaerae bacterium]
MAADDAHDVWRVGPAHRPADAGAVERLSVDLPDGGPTTIYAWRPVEDVGKLPVLYLHGIQSHPGWFTRSAEALWRAGYPVYQITRRGSGDSDSEQGDAASAGQLLADLTACRKVALAHADCRQCHLLGVSWGGKLAAAYAAGGEGAEAIASLTLIAPGIAPKVDVSTWTKLGVAACLLVWRKRRFAIPLSDVDLFTDNEAMRAYLRDDPFRLQTATARFFFTSRRLDWMLRRMPRGSIRAATNLLLASRDRIIDNAATRQVVARLTDGRAATRTIDGCHTMDFEPNPQVFLDALVDAVGRTD